MNFLLKLPIGAFYTGRSKLIIMGNSVKMAAQKLLCPLAKPLLSNVLNYCSVD
jgi:hypothetical protein